MITLDDLQTHALEMARIRGFAGDSIKNKALVLMEEVGELAKAILRGRGSIEEELADCLAVILMIAFLAGMDGDKLGKVCMEKIEADKLRV